MESQNIKSPSFFLMAGRGKFHHLTVEFRNSLRYISTHCFCKKPFIRNRRARFSKFKKLWFEVLCEPNKLRNFQDFLNEILAWNMLVFVPSSDWLHFIGYLAVCRENFFHLCFSISNSCLVARVCLYKEKLGFYV